MDIKELSNKLRIRIIKMSHEAKAPHLASSLFANTKLKLLIIFSNPSTPGTTCITAIVR